MIEASIGAVPGLIVAFLVLAAMTAIPAALVSKSRGKPAVLPALAATAIAGVVTITLLPSGAGISPGQCDTGVPRHVLTSTSALLNIAMFVPASALTVMVFRRPATVAAVFVAVSGGIEFLQAVLPLGRACSATDIAANSIGALIGSVLGSLGVALTKGALRWRGRDALWGAGILLASAVVLAGGFQWRVQAVDVVAIDDRSRAHVDSLEGSDEWLKTAAISLFGKGTQVSVTSADSSGQRSLVTAETNKGTISGWWPDRTLQQGWSTNNRGDEGTVSEDEARRLAHVYAQKWFPASLKGSVQTCRLVGDDPKQGVFVVIYRRYVRDVMMPMRLDITITRSGRIMGFTSQPTADPALPSATISEKDAKLRTEKATGRKATSAKLLAQRVQGTWRPVWLLGVAGGDAYLDAATGRHVNPDQ
ncbi:VanZ family protein [Streptomyces sp. NPDC087440]|uniref:VanZ family protein n=1 Tax=Streptomyces sp. NPDC087440 TaxID=3365790 RepID=UPI00382D4700